MRQAKTILAIFILGAATVLSACGESSRGTDGKGYHPIHNDLNGDPQASVVYMFSGGHRSGNLNGRAGADQFCENELPAELEGLEVHAFISVDASDEIADMPANYDLPTDREIVSYNSETTVATDLADLLDGTLEVSLEAAGVLSSLETFWSGSNPNGTMAVANCNGWETSSSTVFGAAGSSTVTTLWSYTISAACGGLRTLVCVAY